MGNSLTALSPPHRYTQLTSYTAHCITHFKLVLASCWHVEFGSCHAPCAPCPLPCISVGQLLYAGAEKPLGKKHINLEPHTQLGVIHTEDVWKLTWG